MSRHSPALQRWLATLQHTASLGPILDLACGGGRNGGFLAKQGLPVIFADRDGESLADIRAQHPGSHCWQVDLETPERTPLPLAHYGAVLVFNYLYRPLLEELRKAVIPGGLLIYETFTLEQPRYGRPRNPDYLLRPGELKQHFGDWDELEYFEGTTERESGEGQKAIARLVARKPASDPVQE